MPGLPPRAVLAVLVPGMHAERAFEAYPERVDDAADLLSLLPTPEREELTLPPAPAWQREAACVGEPAEAFYPEDRATAKLIIAAAKAVCAECPVKGECLGWALDHDEQGVWGGTSEGERRRMRRAAA